MVLTAGQVTAFFEEANQMAIPHNTVVYLATEGITTPNDLEEFTEDMIKTIATNCRRPAGGAPALVLGAKSIKRLTAASHLLRFYAIIGRTVTAANIRWMNVIKSFDAEWTALQEKKDNDDPTVPTLTGTTVMKWNESFVDNLHQCIGANNVPLAYVIRATQEVVPNEAPPLVPNQAHSEEFGSIEADMIARAPHTGPLYRRDNESLYFKLEVATRGTNKAATIKPYSRTKDGRAAYLALIAQHAGKDRWQTLVQQNESILHDVKWKGNTSYTLDKHCQSHRNAYSNIHAASTHVDCTVPNEFTRVNYLLASIENSDPSLQAALASVRQNDTPDGPKYSFELAVEKILPSDPVARKRSATSKRGNAEVSVTFADEVNISSLKSGIGSTGVHLRYYVEDEYRKLTTEQKKELHNWRLTPEGKAAIAAGKAAAGTGPKRKKFKKSGKAKDTANSAEIKSTFAKLYNEMEAKKAVDNDEALLTQFINSHANVGATSTNSKSSISAVDMPKAASALKRILGRVKNNNDA